MIAAVAQLVLASVVLQPAEVRYFPGSYFDRSERVQLEAGAMESWPGPSALAEAWRSGDLTTEQRVAILLAAPVHRDPSLLPLYREAIQARSPRLRQAAAYGYHDLIGDRLPDVRSGVGDGAAQRLASEMDLLAETLRRHPPVVIWLQAALQGEGRSLPPFAGVAPQRTVAGAVGAPARE